MSRRRKRKAELAHDEQANDAPRAGRASGRVPAWAIALVLVIPLLLVLIYAQFAGGFGRNPLSGLAAPAPQPAGQAPAQGGAASPGDTQPDMTQMAARLAARLEREPNDPKGWDTLAHTYYVLGRFDEAVKAYERLAAIAKPEAATLADYADALAMVQGRRLEGKPMELVRQALALDPSQWKAQSMAATDAFQRKDYATAISHWERALASVAPGSEIAKALEGNIAEARSLQAGK
jgi:cytochrome c-type biogenesis protein CcmH